MKKQTIWVIGGPTASGKSSLAVRLAQQIHGCVVNGDALQVYRDLQILSARPSLQEMEGIPHYLFGFVDAWTTPSVLDWLTKVTEIVPSLENPIIVGGTGMYLDALVEGINEIPDVDETIRQKVRNMSLQEVKSQLKECRFTDSQRMRRALEIQLSTGKPLSYFHDQPKKKFLNANFCVVHVLPDRERVYKSCEKRFHMMLNQGAVDEVRHLMALNATGGVLKAIGVSEIKDYLLEKISLKQAEELAVLSTKHYAKRQMTWFRHHGTPSVVVSDVQSVNIDKLTK